MYKYNQEIATSLSQSIRAVANTTTMKLRFVLAISIHVILISGISGQGQVQYGNPARRAQVATGNQRIYGPSRSARFQDGRQFSSSPVRRGQVPDRNVPVSRRQAVEVNGPINTGQVQNNNQARVVQLQNNIQARNRGSQIQSPNANVQDAQVRSGNLVVNDPARGAQSPAGNNINAPTANNNPAAPAPVNAPAGQGTNNAVRPGTPAPNDNTLVQLPNGPVRGKEWGMYYSWESIPYAEPPVGDLRFEDPQPYNRRWQGEFNATVFPSYCLQWYRDRGVNKRRGQEDCLTVSVYSPKPRGNRYPVVAYFHGGHFMLGGGPEFDPEQSMVGARLIMIKINFRLGPLGFLSTGDSSIPGNYGLKDQRLALQWIKQNIAAFGGDPEKILVLGHGSGGAAAHLHMLQPSLANIAKAVVSMSGVALNPWAITPNARDNAIRLAAAVNCTNFKETLQLKACLKSRNPDDVVSGVQTLLNFGYNPFVTFGPVIEPANTPNAFLTQQPEAIIRSGRFSHIPWLASYTTNDGAFNAAELLRINPRTGFEFLNDLNTNWLDVAPQNLFLQNMRNDAREYAQSLKEAYLGKENFTVKNYAMVQKMYTDILVRLGALKALQLHSRYSKAPVYGYIYDIPANHGIGYDMSLRKDVPFGRSS